MVSSLSYAGCWIVSWKYPSKSIQAPRQKNLSRWKPFAALPGRPSNEYPGRTLYLGKSILAENCIQAWFNDEDTSCRTVCVLCKHRHDMFVCTIWSHMRPLVKPSYGKWLYIDPLSMNYCIHDKHDFGIVFAMHIPPWKKTGLFHFKQFGVCLIRILLHHQRNCTTLSWEGLFACLNRRHDPAARRQLYVRMGSEGVSRHPCLTLASYWWFLTKY